ncbi:MAG: formimidoylglutamate deiminase, partial [Longimicrobiales bacterium]
MDIDGGVIVDVRVGVTRPPGVPQRPGFTMPGLLNVHSHAFHRALRGRTHQGARDFWRWRDAMYQIAARLDPDLYFELARATYAEMALAGITNVYEFHYLHHDRDGSRYADPNEMAVALGRAAAAAGIRLTLLDTCYLRAGLRGEELSPVQHRFADADVGEWAQRVGALALEGDAEVGVAIHSVRAVDPHAISVVAGVADDLDVPLHVHVSEQLAENDECMAMHRMSPTELLAHAGAAGPRTTAVHATHVTPTDVDLLAANGAQVCMCPTTERDLGDGVGPTSAFRQARVPISYGSDSHAVIDLFEEARQAELHERLVSHERGLSPAAFLFEGLIGRRRI